MHSRDLVELAAVVATHGSTFISTPGALPPGAIEQYWTSSKCRLDRWNRALKNLRADHSDSIAAATREVEHGSTEPLPILEEVLISDILTRVWSGVLCAYDRRYGGREVESIARSIWLGHLETRHRVMALLVNDHAIEPAAAVALNRLRRRTERWADLLLGQLLGSHDVSEFAVVHERAREFADDLHHQQQQPGGEHAWPLTLASLRGAFRAGVCEATPNGDANARIAASIVACFPAELFDDSGLVRSLWLARLSTTASDVAGLIEDWFRVDAHPSSGHAVFAEGLLPARRPPIA